MSVLTGFETANRTSIPVAGVASSIFLVIYLALELLADADFSSIKLGL
jgi:hypothetical protein